MVIAFTTIVLGVIGAATYLGSTGQLADGTVASILILVLGGVGVTAGVHVTGSVIAKTNGHTGPAEGQSVTVTRVQSPPSLVTPPLATAEPVTATGTTPPPPVNPSGVNTRA